MALTTDLWHLQPTYGTYNLLMALTTYLWHLQPTYDTYNLLIGIIVGLYSTVASLLDDATVGQNPAMLAVRQNTPWIHKRFNSTHTIHVWYIYLHLPDFTIK